MPGDRETRFKDPGKVTKEKALARVGELAEGWTESQLAFAWWSALGAKRREPKTLMAYSKEIGPSHTTVGEWRQIPGFSDLVLALTKAALALRWPDIVNAIADEAEAGDKEAAKFCGRLLGEYADQGVRVSGDARRPVLFKIVTPTLPAGETVEGEVVESG